MFRRSAALAVLVAAGAACAPAALAGGSRADVYVAFRTPSGNIGCGYSKFEGETAFLRCEVASHLRPVPARTQPCTEGVWGRAVGMQPTGAARGLCISDTVMEPGAPVLAYGRTWRRGGFTCTSRAAGLTCRNLSGHGWFLSRERSRLT